MILYKSLEFQNKTLDIRAYDCFFPLQRLSLTILNLSTRFMIYVTAITTRVGTSLWLQII